jgi:hypothetical protein
MCCCFKGFSKQYNLSLPDIKAGFIFVFDKKELLVRNMMKGKDVRKHQTKKQNTYHANGVTFVVKPSTTWVLAKFICDEVTAVNACYMSFPMSKHNLIFFFFRDCIILAYLLRVIPMVSLQHFHLPLRTDYLSFR